MHYGQIAESEKINSAIYYCFRYIDVTEATKFVRKFKEQPHDKIQIMHTFRELLLGAFLASNNLRMRSEYKIDGKTPDWCIFSEDSHPECIVELVNFHADAETEADIIRQIQEKGLWCNFVKPNTDRLYHAIWRKADTYKTLVNKYNLPYVIAVFSEFTANVEQDELDECLFGTEAGIFKLYPEVSGILFFEEFSGSYPFTYRSNPHTMRRAALPSGCLDTSKARRSGNLQT